MPAVEIIGLIRTVQITYQPLPGARTEANRLGKGAGQVGGEPERRQEGTRECHVPS